jgi:hypothetical protein
VDFELVAQALHLLVRVAQHLAQFEDAVLEVGIVEQDVLNEVRDDVGARLPCLGLPAAVLSSPSTAILLSILATTSTWRARSSRASRSMRTIWCELQLQQLRLCRQRAQTVQLLLGRPQRIRQRLDVGVRVSDGGIHVLQLVEQVAVRLDRLRVPGLEVQLVLLQALDALLHLLPLALLAGDIGLMPDKQRLQGKRQRRPFLTTEPAGQGHAGSLTSSRPDQPPRGPRVLRTVSTISARNETSC